MSDKWTPKAHENLPLFPKPSSRPKPAPLPAYSNPTTSRSAAESVRESAATLRSKVLAFIRDRGGATCDEAEEALGLTHQTASARVNELMNLRWIEDSGKKRPTRSGRKAIVWRAIDYGVV